MTKFTFLTVLMVYAGLAGAETMNYVQASPEVERTDLHATRPHAEAIAHAWKSTFMILIHKPNGHVEYASAFVTFSAVGPRGRRLQLVTSDHALGNWCDDHSCRGVEIHAEGRVTRDPRTNERALESQSLDVSNLRVLRRNAAMDLAIIQITVDPSFAPPVLKIGRQAPVIGETTFLVGFPNVFKGRSDLNVEEPDLLARRWSQGRVQGYGSVDQAGDLTFTENDLDLVRTSVPAKQGSSGGPFVNEEGYVVGVLAWAATTNDAASASAVVNLRDLRTFLRLDDVASN